MQKEVKQQNDRARNPNEWDQRLSQIIFL